MEDMPTVEQPNHLALDELFETYRTIFVCLAHLHLLDTLKTLLTQALQLLGELVLLETELDGVL